MTSIGWQVDPSDWNRDLSGLTNHIVDNITANVRPGSIVLSHDSGGDRSATLAAYRQLLPKLRKKYTFLPLP